MPKFVLAYSGGLDTSVILKWLQLHHDADVVTVTADLGQKRELVGVKEKALLCGASAAYVEDLRDEFVEEYVWPVLKAGALYQEVYPLGSAIGRPLIAKRLVEVAREVEADAIVHGCTGKGNDQVRFELAYKALAPRLKVIAPWREWTIRSREAALEYASKHNVPVPVTRHDLYSRDENIWHISHEGGPLETKLGDPPENAWKLTTSPKKAPDREEKVQIGFEAGVPTAVNGKKLAPIALLEKLNKLAAKHGVGRIDLVENRLVGMKSHGAYETPGGTLLHWAHRELEALCLDRETFHYKQHVGLKYGELVYYGHWFTPLREALDGFVASTERSLTGSVTLGLYKGNVRVFDRQSSESLYDTSIAAFTMKADYDQKDAEGFINLLGLPTKIAALKRSKGGKK